MRTPPPFYARISCLVLFFISSISSSLGQTSCGTDAYNSSLQQKNPTFLSGMKAIKQQWINFNRTGRTSRPQEDIYVLPVVFHIIHKNGPENLADAEIYRALQLLNDAFANRAFFDQGTGVNTNIQFCLAKMDPDNRFTTGITHTYADMLTVVPEVDDERLKSLIDWDPTRYINIWIVKDIDAVVEGTACGVPDSPVAGYSTMPPSHGSASDGIVIEAAAVASVALVHEMGHYLGLYHTFQGYCTNNDCVVDGDEICDTPPEQTVSITGGCSQPENSCSTDALSGFATDQNDLKTNYMDYGNAACANDFTQGQKDRMRFMIENVRSSLLASTVCTNDCGGPASAAFTFTDKDFPIGSIVSFTNTSAGAQAYEWYVDGVLVSNAVNLTYTLTAQGWHKIELVAKPNPDQVKCRNSQIAWVRVFCAVRPYIGADKKRVTVQEKVHFGATALPVNNQAGTVSYQWYSNDTPFGTGAELDYQFTTPGLKIVYAVTTKGACLDTSNRLAIDVKPLPDYTIDIPEITCEPNGTKKVKFKICNNSGVDAPAGIPVSFYATDPTSSAALLIGTVFHAPAISRYCCVDFETELPASFKNDTLFGVINDDHSHLPPYSLATDFPVTAFPESNYLNNIDSALIDNLKVTISPQDISIPIGADLPMTAQSDAPATQFTWLVSHGTLTCVNCDATTLTTNEYTQVILQGVNESGCIARDTIIVTILANQDIIIPSAFTPNDDALNDIFYVLGSSSVKNINSFAVFNRWGQQVFLRRNILPNIPSVGWKGTVKGQKAASDVYVYEVWVNFVNGKKRLYKGTVTLIR